MADSRNRWDERAERFKHRPVRSSIKGITMGWLIVLIVITIGVITTTMLWAFGVFTSDIKGQGDAERIKNSAPNRIAAQELFETRYADIQAADRNIGVTAAALALDPNNPKLRTEYNGQRMYCHDLVGKYDADARKFTREGFRAADLPVVIDVTDPRTDCKENAR